MSHKISLPFDWKSCFVPDQAADCIPACIAMAARYWSIQRPDLKIPNTLKDWLHFVEDQKGMTSRGTSIARLTENLTKLVPSSSTNTNLTIEPLTLINVESTIEFLKHNPPIPLILTFDRSYTITNIEGGYHASLLYAIDYERQKKIFLIDPSSVELMEPYPWDLDRFSLGWEKMENLCYAVYPTDIQPISSKKGVRSKSIHNYTEIE